jgi:protein-glutamine gamma-glutamyltransferase
VVLRARVPSITALRNDSAREAVISALYWRGTVYDTYDRGQWIRSRDERARTLLTPSASQRDLGRSYLVTQPFAMRPPTARRLAVKDTIEQELEIVALSHPVAFALDRPVVFEMPSAAPGSFTAVDVEARWSDEVSLRVFRVNPANPYERRQTMSEFLGARYRAYSRDQGRTDVGYPSHAQLPQGALDNYLRVPASLGANVRELARQITAGQETGAAKVEAVVSWLRRTHSYTTTLKRDERIADPLEDFLFAETAGHCEYFASAAAILLRVAGIPTRYVNGFLGGEWNSMREGITVRENRAHAWIEAYLDGEGWVRVDATPATRRPARMGGLRQLLDSAELLWGRWVVEYSASQQLVLAQRLGQKLGLHGKRYGPGRTAAPLSRKQTLAITGIVMLAIVLWTQRKRLGRWRRRDTRELAHVRGADPVHRLYQTTVARLAAGGLPRLPCETPHEYLARVRQSPLEGATLFEDLTTAYTSSRYGEVDIPPETVARLRGECRHIDVAR